MKPAAGMEARLDKIKPPFVKPPGRPLPLGTHNGENTIEFNKYTVLYSNNVTGNLSSPGSAGVSEISCYMDSAYVGVIAFYETAENMHRILDETVYLLTASDVRRTSKELSLRTPHPTDSSFHPLGSAVV